MDRFRGLLTLHLVVLTTWALPAVGQEMSYGRVESGTIRRLDRITASILRRKMANRSPNLGCAEPPPPPFMDLDSPAEQIMVPGPSPGFVPDASFFPPQDIGSSYGPQGRQQADRGCPGCSECRACRTSCWIDTLSLWTGVNGFTGPFNRGQDGSFGFQQGVNWGSPWVFSPLCMNTQIGFRAVQSDFHGANFTNESREQYFLTAGFFRRAECGWQGGVVFDYLHEEWNIRLDVGQVRGEISWAVPNGSSFGMRFASAVSTDVINPGIEAWETHDWYTMFYEAHSKHLSNSVWRAFVGFTGASDGIIGSDLKVALSGTCSLEPAFTYLIPDEARGAGGNQAEAWNIAFNLVWYPGRSLSGIDYRRLPMFDVAGNGLMIAHRK